MPSLVFSRQVQGPATHALVIGVGHYPALIDPDPNSIVSRLGLAQLESPPVSARAFAQFLVENYHCPSRPLASVQLHVSEPVPSPFCFTFEGTQYSPMPGAADMQTLEKAIQDWSARSKSLDDLQMFYFCGHGIADLSRTSLLASDFAQHPQAPMKGALDFVGMHIGLESCVARNQCFFLDACRADSKLYDRIRDAGNSVLQNVALANPGGLPRVGPTFYSTLANKLAYARPGKTSIFTEALIEAMSGPAATDRDTGEWTVITTQLQAALDFLVRESVHVHKLGGGQLPEVDGLQEIPLNTLKSPPIVPVVLYVEPEQAHLVAEISYDDGKGHQEARAADPSHWRLRLPAGNYTFRTDFASAKFKSTPSLGYVQPPYLRKPLTAEAVP